MCAQSLMRVSLLILQYMLRLLAYMDGEKANNWDTQNSENIKEVTKWLRELREKFGDEV